MRRMNNDPRAAAGFNLIEVMVALVVLSLGLAGLAALLVNGVASTRSADLRSIATTYAQSGADVMRANLEAYTNGWFDGTNTTSIASAVDCSSGCTTESDMAQSDFALWQTRIAQALPDGQAFICNDTTPDDGQPGALACTGGAADPNVIKIFWRDPRDVTFDVDGDTHHRFAWMVNP